MLFQNNFYENRLKTDTKIPVKYSEKRTANIDTINFYNPNEPNLLLKSDFSYFNGLILRKPNIEVINNPSDLEIIKKRVGNVLGVTNQILSNNADLVKQREVYQFITSTGKFTNSYDLTKINEDLTTAKYTRELINNFNINATNKEIDAFLRNQKDTLETDGDILDRNDRLKSLAVVAKLFETGKLREILEYKKAQTNQRNTGKTNPNPMPTKDEIKNIIVDALTEYNSNNPTQQINQPTTSASTKPIIQPTAPPTPTPSTNQSVVPGSARSEIDSIMDEIDISINQPTTAQQTEAAASSVQQNLPFDELDTADWKIFTISVDDLGKIEYAQANIPANNNIKFTANDYFVVNREKNKNVIIRVEKINNDDTFNVEKITVGKVTKHKYNINDYRKLPLSIIIFKKKLNPDGSDLSSDKDDTITFDDVRIISRKKMIGELIGPVTDDNTNDDTNDDDETE